jgi:short-subunit dehydrogenase
MTENSVQAERLGQVPLFASLAPAELAEWAASLETVAVSAGATIFREGERGDEMFIVAAGAVRIIAESRGGGLIAELGPGDFFGETALISGFPRSASAVASRDTRLWRMSQDRFDRMVRAYPALSVEMGRVLRQRAQRPVTVGRNLVGRTALLTGASRGIGVFIAQALAREGCNLVLVARSPDALDEVRRQAEELGVRAIAVPTDVGNQAELQTLVLRAMSEFGAIDLLINNAGLLLTLAYHKVYSQEIEDIVRVNLTGPMFLSWLVLPAMLERGSGHIVNIASLAGKYGPAYNELYASSKAALIAFTQSLRASYRGSGVSASVICPGFVETGMYERSRRHGLRAPRMLGSTTPQQVADAVITAIRKDQPETILNPGPIRFMMALPTLFPALAEWGRIRLGADTLYRKAAEIRERKRLETGR